ncbi:MAG: hypothetical protein K2L89_05760 [Muribaculaceae bacterium]|nr:hypothetical protein [Muribaculaceae bacterium]
MKRFFLIISLLSISLTTFARQPKKGYRGFFEWSNSLRSEEIATFTDGELNISKGYRETFFFTGASTSHGYQINPMFFVGAGLAFEYNSKWDTWIAPLFAQGRLDLQLGKFTPFADVRLGWNMTDGGGVFFSPTVGYRFNWGRKLGINVGLGMSLIDYKIDKYEGSVDLDNNFYEIYYTGTYHKAKPYFSFRVGIDF